MSRRRHRGGGLSAPAAIRLGAALAIAGPVAWFAARWFLAGGDLAGLLSALAVGAIDGAVELAGYVLGHPVQGLVYLGALCLVSRLAFGRGRH